MRRLADRYLTAVVEGFRADPRGRDRLPAVFARACVAVLPVMGAGLGLVEKLRVPLGGSDDTAVRAERLQTTLGEGPCLGAIEAGEALRADEPEIAARWPVYHRELVRQTPFRSVASLPLRVAGQPPIGALDLYSTSVEMDPAAVGPEVQSAIADQISGLLLGAPLVSADWTDEPVAAWLAGRSVADRMEVWKAVGMLVHGLGVTQGEGLDALRDYAVRQGSTLDAVAARVTALELDPAVLSGDRVGAAALPPGVRPLDAKRRRGPTRPRSERR